MLPGATSRAFRSRAALPSEWDRRHYGRHQLVQEYLKVEGLTVKYVGPGEQDSQAATIFADKPVPQDVPLYYFEVAIVNKGDSGYIGVGFCADTVNLGRLPGWEPHSYGYHGDDGHAFHGSGQGRPFGPGFTTGDVVGALLDRSRKTISYYKNGEPVGVAFFDVQEQQLYPCVGMRTKHEEVRANFGGAPFCVDLNKLHAEFRERVLAEIAAIELPVSIEVPSTAEASRRLGPIPGSRPAPPPPPPPLPGASAREVASAARRAAMVASAYHDGSTESLEHVQATTYAFVEAVEAVMAERAGRSAPTAAAAAGAAAAGAEAAEAPAAGGGGGSSSRAAGAAAAGQQQPAPGDAAAAAAAGKDKDSKASTAEAAKPQSQPLMLYYVFNYLLHRRCWRTASIIAQEMLAAGSDSSCSSNGGSDPAPAAAAAAAAAGPTPMEASTNGAAEAAVGDQPMPDAAAAAAEPSTAPQPPAAAAADAAAGPSSSSIGPMEAVAAALAAGGRKSAAASGAFSQEDVQDALLRQKIYDTVCAGYISQALEAVSIQYGLDPMKRNPHLHFKLRVQQFVELVRQACSSAAQQQQQQVAGVGPAAAPQSSNGAGAAHAAAAHAAAAEHAAAAAGPSSGGPTGFEEALAYGRRELGPGLKSGRDEELLSDALSLLAYADPAASPCGYLLRESYRADLAEELNGALLQARGSSGRPLLECAYRQAVVLVQELKRLNLPAALVLDVPSLCCSSSAADASK